MVTLATTSTSAEVFVSRVLTKCKQTAQVLSRTAAIRLDKLKALSDFCITGRNGHVWKSRLHVSHTQCMYQQKLKRLTLALSEVLKAATVA